MSASANAANCVLFERDHPNIKYVTRGQPFFLFSSAFVIRQSDTDWLHFLNSSIRQLQANGFAKQLEAKYNPTGGLLGPGQATLIPCITPGILASSGSSAKPC